MVIKTMKKTFSLSLLLRKTGWMPAILLLTLVSSGASAQVPQGIPYEPDPDPINFNSAWNILLFIVLPIAAFIFYYFWRKKKLKQRDRNRG
jgi:uncharacterized BrkB/YihY/UPF0761 family membrane protein